MKTVESLLEKGLIEVANKEEELKVCLFYCLERDGLGYQSLKKHPPPPHTFGSHQHTLSEFCYLPCTQILM